jgi:hypothetical protein
MKLFKSFNDKFYSLVIIIILASVLSTLAVDNYGEVNSRSQAMSIMSEYGEITINDGIIIYNQRGEWQAYGMPTELLQAIALMSEQYEIHM